MMAILLRLARLDQRWRGSSRGATFAANNAAEWATHAHTKVERSEPRGVRTLVRELAWARYAHTANVAT
jgi:hypothetical protein